MGVIPFIKAKSTQLHHDSKSGAPLYPYHADEYQHLHIVGHLFQNGEYLPVKVFVAPEMVKVEQSNTLRREAERRSVNKGMWRGVGIACAGWFALLCAFLAAFQ